MTDQVRDALEQILTAPKVPAPPDIGTTVTRLAPLVEKALRETAVEMAELLTRLPVDEKVIVASMAAGIAVLTEGET